MSQQLTGLELLWMVLLGVAVLVNGALGAFVLTGVVDPNQYIVFGYGFLAVGLILFGMRQYLTRWIHNG